LQYESITVSESVVFGEGEYALFFVDSFDLSFHSINLE
jgi:hypothetical protein